MHAVDFAVIVYGVYVPLLLGLYVLEIIVIVRHHKKAFNSSFFRIFVVLATVNIVACVVGSFVGRLPLYPGVNGFYSGLSTNSGWLTAANSCNYYLNCLSEFLGVFLAFNRFTTLYFPMLHDGFWRWALVLGITGCCLVAFAPVWYLLGDADKFAPIDIPSHFDYVWYHLSGESRDSQASVWINMFIVTAVCNSASFLLYCACLARLSLFSAARNQTLQRNFFLVGFLSMIFSLPYMGAMLYFYINLSTISSTLDVNLVFFTAYQVPWLTDLKYLSPAPMLLVTNKSIRSAIKIMLARNDVNKISSVSKNLTQGSKPKPVLVVSNRL